MAMRTRTRGDTLTRRDFLSGAAMVAVLSACGSDGGAKPKAAGTPAARVRYPVSIAHKFGSTTIPKPPERVATLGYSEQDPVLALGVKPVAVREWFGAQPYATFPWAKEALGDAKPEVLTMPFGELNYERIATLRPDLIVATHSGIKQEEYGRLAQVAPVVAIAREVMVPPYLAPGLVAPTPLYAVREHALGPRAAREPAPTMRGSVGSDSASLGRRAGPRPASQEGQ